MSIEPTGRKRWLYLYRFDGRSCKITISGAYPETSLSAARAVAASYREMIARRINPATVRASATLNARLSSDAKSRTFEAVAREYVAKSAPARASGYAADVLGRLSRDVFGALGSRPVAEITGADVLSICRGIEERGSATSAARVLAIVCRVFRYAVASGYTVQNPAAGLSAALCRRSAHHYAAVIDPASLGTVLRAVRGYRGSPELVAALRLLPMLMVRPGNLRKMRWADVNLETGIWTIPADEMKVKNRGSFVVSLPLQAVAILADLRRLTGRGEYVFPGAGGLRPITSAALSAAWHRLGLGGVVTSHGWRATARTVCAERLGIAPAVLEAALAHGAADPLRGAYDRTSYTVQRADALQRWADYLESLERSEDK